ncbi:MAG: endo-1,4-beta-xylanase [Planctomycetota bacterium]
MKFKVFKQGNAADEFSLCGVYLFGPEGIPTRSAGPVTFKDGIIQCTKRNTEAAGIALLWPIEGFGRILLSTTRLPDKDILYNLNVELARAKLMQITTKREDWSLFDDSNDSNGTGHEAQNFFIQAVQNISEPPVAAKLADESLSKAMVFGEELTIRHAEMCFQARLKSRNFGRGSLGCCIDPKRITEPEYLEKLTGTFGFVTVPINWAQIEPWRGNWNFTMIDKCVEVLRRKRLAICIGPLLQFSARDVPQWLLAGEGGFEKIREAAFQFVTKITSRYSKHVHAWKVVSGINAMNCFGFGFEQVLEITRAASLAARGTSDRSLKIIEITCPWGEYYADSPNTIPPLVYADMVVQSGIGFDAFALPLEFGKNQPGMHLRDLMQVSAVIDRFASLNRPLHITAVAVPDRNGSGDDSCEKAGLWHSGWDESLQGQWTEQLYKIALSKPFVNTVTYSDFADIPDQKITGCGLLTGQLTPKKVFRVIGKLQKLIMNR